MSLTLKIIVAVDDDWSIGKDGDLPWPRNKADMAFFKRMTLGRPVIMGRKTWESIPAKFRPLNDRLNIIVTTNEDYDPGVSDPDQVRVFTSLAEAINDLRTEPYPEAFVIGGASLYNHAAVFNSTSEIYLSNIHGSFDGDTTLAELFVDGLKTMFQPVWQQRGPDGSVSFEKWVRNPQ